MGPNIIRSMSDRYPISDEQLSAAKGPVKKDLLKKAYYKKELLKKDLLKKAYYKKDL